MAPQKPQKNASPATDERPADLMAEWMYGAKPKFEEAGLIVTHDKRVFLRVKGWHKATRTNIWVSWELSAAGLASLTHNGERALDLVQGA
jgi:hypothetical protein